MEKKPSYELQNWPRWFIKNQFRQYSQQRHWMILILLISKIPLLSFLLSFVLCITYFHFLWLSK